MISKVPWRAHVVKAEETHVINEPHEEEKCWDGQGSSLGLRSPEGRKASGTNHQRGCVTMGTLINLSGPVSPLKEWAGNGNPMLRGFTERLVQRDCHQVGSPQLAPNTRGDSLRNLDINRH